MRRPTQTDVARKAGVSRATVSYVLNNQNGQKIPISSETRQRVLGVIAELGYEPDARAQSLRGGSTKTIGVLFPILQNPFFWQLLYGISSELETAGYSLHLSQSPVDPDQEIHSKRALAQYRVDGFILLGDLLSTELSRQLNKFGRPIVSISSVDSEMDHVLHSYADGTRALMNLLFELGHRRIGFVYGVAGRIQALDRLLVYRQVLTEYGLPVDDSLVPECGDTLGDGYQAAYRLLSRPDRPTAVLAINDLLGVAVIRAAIDLGLRIPDDVSIASFDDIPFASYTVPRLTTVSGQTEQSGRDAVKLLLQRLNQPDIPVQVITAKPHLIIRESTGPAPF